MVLKLDACLIWPTVNYSTSTNHAPSFIHVIKYLPFFIVWASHTNTVDINIPPPSRSLLFNWTFLIRYFLLALSLSVQSTSYVGFKNQTQTCKDTLPLNNHKCLSNCVCGDTVTEAFCIVNYSNLSRYNDQ